MLDFPALLRALEAAARASAGAVEEEELEAEMLRFLGRDGAEGEAVGPAGDDPLTFLLLKSFGRAGGATACARAFGALAPLQRRALLRAAPAFLFELVRRRQRRQLELLLGLEPRLLAALRQRGEDLLVWACRQRGLTHGIVKALLRSGVFPAGEALPLDRAAEGSESPRHRARLAAFRAASSVRNRHVLAILAEAWPEVESPKPAGSGGGLSAFRTPPVVADAGEAG